MPAASSLPTWLTGAAVIAALLGVLVALFKDELWHQLHAPRFEVSLERGGLAREKVQIRIRNTSKRLAAENASVRVTEVVPHPLEAAIGPRGISGIVAVDLLLKRRSGESIYAVAPQGQVLLDLVDLTDANDPDQPVKARPAWDGPVTNVDYDNVGGLLVLPSQESRESWAEQMPGVRMDSAALVHLEVAASNVPARLYTVKLYRSPHVPPARDLPMAATSGGAQLYAELFEGSVNASTPFVEGLPPGGQDEADAYAAMKQIRANPPKDQA
ncbi:MAG: hypothetical protein QOH58_1507 [Thermoleophilaceae bacterium]|nr:hypothetical protein [Thermoleophilaceae bacterium]